jgi:hypothetical protein
MALGGIAKAASDTTGLAANSIQSPRTSSSGAVDIFTILPLE